MKVKVTKTAPINKKQAIARFVKGYAHPFEMKEDAIDLREMARNYQHEIIPLEDIHKAIVTVVGPTAFRTYEAHDPSGGAAITYPASMVSPRFEYVMWDQMYLWPLFQRDVAPNHVEKINRGFDHSCVIVPCAIKITLKDKGTIYCLWDGHHTVQTCKLRNYTKFPVWVIDIDHVPLSEIEAAGFGNTDEERIKYGIWRAGTNMRNINGKMKRQLSPYDDFMIGYETRDAQYVSMMNILRKHGCTPKRHATAAGAFTQIKSGVECYSLRTADGVEGAFWDRAIQLHRKTWKLAPLTLEIFRPLSYLFYRAALEGYNLPASFDDELAQILVKWSKSGDPDSIQEEIKESFWAAYHGGTLMGNLPDHDKDRVLSGIINLYIQNGGKCMLPAATCQWKV